MTQRVLSRLGTSRRCTTRACLKLGVKDSEVSFLPEPPPSTVSRPSAAAVCSQRPELHVRHVRLW